MKGIKRKIDLDTWNRKEHFEFFRNMKEQFHSVCVELDATKAYDYCKQNHISFFLRYMHSLGMAAMDVENFRYRIEDDQVYCYDSVDLSATIGREDETFGFGLLGFTPDLKKFVENAEGEIARVNSVNGLNLSSNAGKNNLIYCSAIPWLRFSCITHASSFSSDDSSPKITFGKSVMDGGRRVMPVSIAANHALVDGIHIAKLIDRLQYYLDTPV
ncbi:chloramphenicol acetyltransferase [Halosquirtibacter xylanolyticus]|uniref:chloramphenicol acetyltransferase n=1 Tax=Halosquirtibacter xylanolyticus TaxID=3374599 RepID=UPI0037495AA7|nr:chloramphenicol acetyltransferase [Prolixibacteraceae bacterium]